MTAPRIAKIPSIPPLAWNEITPIPEPLQPAYAEWLQRNEIGPEDEAQSAYDYPGAFMAGIERDPVGGHFPDTFKRHGHDSFSDESRYSGGRGDAGHWDGEVFIPAGVEMPERGELIRLAIERVRKGGKR